MTAVPYIRKVGNPPKKTSLFPPALGIVVNDKYKRDKSKSMKIVQREGVCECRIQIIQLKALGQMPDSLTGNPAGELVSKYDELLIKVKTPLTEEEVEALIGIFPESTMYEVEWTLLHLVETYMKPELLSKYRNLISKCPSEEWRDTMKVRLDNWEKKDGRHI